MLRTIYQRSNILLGDKGLDRLPYKGHFRGKMLGEHFKDGKTHTHRHSPRKPRYGVYYLQRSFGQCVLSKVKVGNQDCRFIKLGKICHERAENTEIKIFKCQNLGGIMFLGLKINITLSTCIEFTFICNFTSKSGYMGKRIGVKGKRKKQAFPCILSEKHTASLQSLTATPLPTSLK